MEKNPNLGEFRDTKKQQRKNARIRLTNLLGTFFLVSEKKEYECQILDLGTGGLGLSTKTLLYPGDKIIVKFWLEDQMFELPSIVSRVSGKNVGVIFENIQNKEIEKIQSFIHKNFFHKK
ncbi:MAG: PilZ domain-containing protein [Leptonema sp. (in: bacteria)]